MANLDLETLVNDINEKAALEDVSTLTYDEIINKLIMESNYPDDIKADLTFYATESFKKSPISKFMKELEDIKNAKPDEYSDQKEVKNFVDKNFDKIKKAADILEKEPEDLTKSSVENLMAIYGLLIVGLISLAAGSVFVPIITGIIVTILSIASTVLTYSRTHNDSTATKNLKKIKDGLKKINTNKLPESYQKRINRLISAIEDAETSVTSKMKVKVESAINTELQEKKLAIYEKCANGEITIEEREQMLSDLREDIIIDHIAESSNNDDLKYNKARLMIYEKCSNGEITEDTREVLLAKLKEKMNK